MKQLTSLSIPQQMIFEMNADSKVGRPFMAIYEAYEAAMGFEPDDERWVGSPSFYEATWSLKQRGFSWEGILNHYIETFGLQAYAN